MKKIVKGIIRSKVIWALVFVVVAAYVGKLGYDHYTAQANKPQVVTNIIRVTKENAQEVFTSGKPIFVEICVSDICDMQRPELEKVAERYKGKVTFVLIDDKEPALQGAIFKLVVKTAGREFPVAFPMHAFISSEGKPVGFFQGVVDATMLEGFVQGGLQATTTAPSNGAGGESAEPATTVPGAPAPSGNTPADGETAPVTPSTSGK